MITAETIRQALKCGEPGCACGSPQGHVHCPAHEDRTPSLSVTNGGDKILVKCFGGCEQNRVIEELKARNLWPSRNGNRPPKFNIVKAYDYADGAGKMVFQVCRTDTKQFPARRPDPAQPGKWIWSLAGITRYPYRLPELLKGKTVFVVEGEKDADNLVALGLTATTNPGGASEPGKKSKWRPEYNPHFQGKAVVILPDNDPPGKAHALDVARNLHGVAGVVLIVELPGLPPKGDVSDWLAAGGTVEELKRIVDVAPDWEPQEQAQEPTGETTAAPELPPDRRGPVPEPQKPTLKPFTARELGAKVFPEPRWAIPDLIPEGLTILGGRPKIGKSWFALNLAVAAATGGVALGKIQVEQGECLYLALEDTPRRLKERLEKIIPFGDLPDTLHFITANDFPLLFKGGLDALSAWLTDHPQARLVVIDTLARVKPPRGKNDAYEHDSQVMSALQGLAALHQLALIVVAHTKKGKEDDFLSNILGSSGQTGVADCVAEITRKARGQMGGTLKLTGRDIQENELPMRFVPDLGMWELLEGEPKDYEMSKERQDILLILKETGPKKPAQLAKLLDKKSGAVRIALMRMKDKKEVILKEDGSYEYSV